MANYFKQCDCGRYTDVVPCYDCLEKENYKMKAVMLGAIKSIGEARKNLLYPCDINSAAVNLGVAKNDLRRLLEGGGE